MRLHTIHDPAHHGTTVWRRVRNSTACVLAAAGLVLSAAQAQDKPANAGAGGATFKPPAPVVLIDKPSLDKLMVDPKDEAFKKALAMIPTRLRELPREVPGMEQVPMPVVDLMLQLITRPTRFAMTYSPDNPSKGAFGAGVVFSLGMDDEQGASSMHGTITALTAMGGDGVRSMMKPSQAYAGMTEITTPFGLLAYGPRKSDEAGWRYEVHFGSLEHPDKPFAGWAKSTDLVKGFEPVIRAHLDPRPLTPLVNMGVALAGGGPEVNELVKQFQDMGYIGDGAVKYSYYSGFTADRSVSVTIAQGAKKFAAKTGAVPEALSAAELKALPADAVTAGMMRFNWKSGVEEMIDQAVDHDPEFADGLAQMEGQIGLSLKNDILPALGNTFGWYLAPSAGGRGLGSAVGLVAIGDKAKFDALNNRLMGALNAMGSSPQVKGYVRGRQWTHEGLALNTLTFPGIPVPFEITYAATDKWMVLGFTPQAALAGAAQASGKGDAGVTTNAALAAMMPKDKQVHSLTFIDSTKTMADGYQYLSMIGSAVANAVRSPVDAGREPGLVVPSYKTLVEGAKPTVKFSYVSGEDIVSESHSDRSVLVNSCGMIGAMAPAFPVIGAFIGAMGAAAQQNSDMMDDFEDMDLDMDDDEEEGADASWRRWLPNDAPWHIVDSSQPEQSELVWAR